MWAGAEALASRQKRVIENTRYHITRIARQADTIADLSPTVRLEGLCHQCGANAAVFAGCGVVLSQRIPR